MTAKASYLEHYLDSLEQLPIELRRNFRLLRDLDERTQEEMKKADVLAERYLAHVKKTSTPGKREDIFEIRKAFKKASDYSDDKIQLATQTYEMVDKHIRKLDSDLARFEADIRAKCMNPSLIDDEEEALRKKNRKLALKQKKKNKKIASDKEEISKSVRRKLKEPIVSQPETGAVPATLAVNPPSDVLDMPVDPNEPTYCYCHQVSYGEMIGCDNPDCPIEWFHFSCVGLTSKPKGKWYCTNCSTDKKKK